MNESERVLTPEEDAEAMRRFLAHRTAPEGDDLTQWDVYLAHYATYRTEYLSAPARTPS